MLRRPISIMHGYWLMELLVDVKYLDIKDIFLFYFFSNIISLFVALYPIDSFNLLRTFQSLIFIIPQTIHDINLCFVLIIAS